MKINNKEIKQEQFAYDGCHKIYLCDNDDIRNAQETGYTVYPIGMLKDTYNTSCSLRFISNWKLTEHYVRQFEECVISY